MNNILILILALAGWLCMAVIFEAGYRTLKPQYAGGLQKHQWCWIWWTLLGVLAFATSGPAGLVQLGFIFCLAAGHIRKCWVKEDVIPLLEIIRNIPAALRAVYESFINNHLKGT
ncbi:MAG: hypothetical protein WCS52_05585 [bacterium]|jgi:hypothetical protein